MKIQRVLCPVDYSSYSRRALHHAAAIANTYDADLHVLHVAPELPPEYAAFAGVTPAVAGVEADWAALHALDEFVRATVRLPTWRATRRGRPSAAIVEYARDVRADLIVLGTHGRSGFDHVLLGSTAEPVVHHAPCPVLTVPRDGDDAGSGDRVRFTHVLCAVDFSPESREALARGLSLAREHGAAITVLHVLETLSDEEARSQAHYRVGEYIAERQRDALLRLETLLSPEVRGWCRVETLVQLGRPARVILREAEARTADLIVMGAQGHGALGLLLFGSTTQTVLREATCPVLTARPSTPEGEPLAQAAMARVAAS